MTFALDLWVTWNVAQYPLHHVTYAAAKFEAATSNGLWGESAIACIFLFKTREFSHSLQAAR